MDIEGLIKELEMLRGKDYEISYNIEPLIKEYRIISGDGKRYIYYERTITIIDKEPTFEEDIKQY